MYSNCVFFAIALYLRRARKGDAGYIVFRRSRYGRFFHCLYLHRQRRLIHFRPVNPRVKILPPPLFKGAVTWGDH